jgi:hypothetical protein
MKLKYLCEVKTNFPDADFWLIRKGTIKEVGKPTKKYSPENIGIKVTKPDVIYPDYLYYALMSLHNQGEFEKFSRGTLKLQNIRVDDIKNISFG